MGYSEFDSEFLTFALSIPLGLAVGLVYSVFKFLRIKANRSAVETVILDLLFWAVAAFMTFCFLVIRCRGQVRLYVLVGVFLGFMLVRRLLSNLIVKSLTAASNLLGSLFSAVFGVFGRIFRFAEKYFKKIYKICKKGLQQGVKLLYNQLKLKISAKKIDISSKNEEN